jgi:hypothetical protein
MQIGPINSYAQSIGGFFSSIGNAAENIANSVENALETHPALTTIATGGAYGLLAVPSCGQTNNPSHLGQNVDIMA